MVCWRVGIRFAPEGVWSDTQSVELYVYDAGTDSGTNFTSPNSDTNPREPIALLGTPFAGTPPIGFYSFHLVSVTGITGDFDADGDYACDDIDALVNVIATQTNSPAFDLTGDGLVNDDDLDFWLAEAGGAELTSGNAYLVGDANLDGIVDVSDFNLWNNQRFTTFAGWCGGDFNADGVNDVSDFNLFNGNRFMSANQARAVPEPQGLAFVWLCGWGLIGTWRRKPTVTRSVSRQIMVQLRENGRLHKGTRTL